MPSKSINIYTDIFYFSQHLSLFISIFLYWWMFTFPFLLWNTIPISLNFCDLELEALITLSQFLLQRKYLQASSLKGYSLHKKSSFKFLEKTPFGRQLYQLNITVSNIFKEKLHKILASWTREPRTIMNLVNFKTTLKKKKKKFVEKTSHLRTIMP